MASITYWNRLEVRPRSANISAALSARIRDPLWMLTRQWQFGEFRGEDAAGPAYVQVSATKGRLLGWQKDAQAVQAVTAGSPLEPVIQAEPFTPDLASRVEVGQLFEKLLKDAGVPDVVRDFRTAYPITPMSDEEFAAAPDREAARFLQVIARRTLDGIALYQAAKAAAPGLPAAPVIDQTKRDSVRGALTKLGNWIQEVWGDFGAADAVDWDPERLEYNVSLVAAAPSNQAVTIEVRPGGSGDFAWQALEIDSGAPAGVTVPADAVQSFTRSVIPGHVRFRGMPNHRWWDFENSQMDFGSVASDKSDLAKLVVMDFMLVQGNDWFTLPLELETGSLCRVDSLIVHDVFGGTTQIERADANAADAGQRWTLFSTSAPTTPGGLADYFLLPPNTGPVAQDGIAIEEVHFLRDEMANMAWAVEFATENGLGKPWPGHERDLALNASPGPAPAANTPGNAAKPPLRYQLQTRVPENWIPLLPVAIDPAQGDIALERGAMLRDAAQPTPILPAGRILQPSSRTGRPYRIREEEVPREGVRVSRVICRTRGCDGATHLWVARRKQIGRGEGSSGLRFDLALENL
jgi:hypothetical protein